MALKALKALLFLKSPVTSFRSLTRRRPGTWLLENDSSYVGEVPSAPSCRRCGPDSRDSSHFRLSSWGVCSVLINSRELPVCQCRLTREDSFTERRLGQGGGLPPRGD